MTDYLRFIIKNTEPLRFSDNSLSGSGQTATLKYIPGSAVRGFVINSLAQDASFSAERKKLLSDSIRFLNAYPILKEADGYRTLIPSPKGFYENKIIKEGKKELQNVVVRRDFEEGFKRAGLGDFCYVENDTLRFISVVTGSDLKIRINIGEGEKQNVYRNDYISPGHFFEGYIVFDKAALQSSGLTEKIRTLFNGFLYLGNARSSGLGKCEVELCEMTDKAPYHRYASASSEKRCYLMLLSPAVMRNTLGDLCGLDVKSLEERMGVHNLNILSAATYLTSIRGYNRTMGGNTPSAEMYDKGSVFRLEFDGVLKQENIKELMDEGIGIRRNEGFGRVLFFEQYPDIRYKEKAVHVEEDTSDISVEDLSGEEKNTLKLIAASYYRNLLSRGMSAYIVNHPLLRSRVSNNQIGTLRSMLEMYRADYNEAMLTLGRYYGHINEKEESKKLHRDTHQAGYLEKEVLKVLDISSFGEFEKLLNVKTSEADTVMGIQKSGLISDEEFGRMKIKLLIDWIRFDNRKNG